MELENKKKWIVFYGYNSETEQKVQEMENSDYKVKYIIDKQADKIGIYREIPIIKEENFLENCKEEKNSYIIIFMLRNARQHDEIAERFYQTGFQRLLYICMDHAVNADYRKEICKQYNMFLDGQKIDFNNLILRPKKKEDKFCKDSVLIRREGDYYICWVNRSIIYVNGIPEAAFYEYMDLVNFLVGGVKNPYAYLEFTTQNLYGHLEPSKYSEILEERYKLFEAYQYEFNLGMDFFIQAAARAVWDFNGYFNVFDGNHRVIFLLYKKLNWIPLRIHKKDYEIWENKIESEKLIYYLKKNNKKIFSTLSPNPYMREIRAIRENMGTNILEQIQLYFREKKVAGQTVVDISDMDGYFARNAKRMELGEIHLHTHKKYELISLINSAERIKDIHLYKEIEDILQKKADIIFAFHLSDDFIEKIIKNIKHMECKMFFCEIQNENLIESIFQITGFTKNKYLGKCMIGKEIKTAYVFE